MDRTRISWKTKGRHFGRTLALRTRHEHRNVAYLWKKRTTKTPVPDDMRLLLMLDISVLRGLRKR
jgi:hypothetical protein